MKVNLKNWKFVISFPEILLSVQLMHVKTNVPEYVRPGARMPVKIPVHFPDSGNNVCKM